MCLPLSPADPHGSQGPTWSFHAALEHLSPPFPANSWSTVTNSIPQKLFQNFCKHRDVSSVTSWRWCKRNKAFQNFPKLTQQERVNVWKTSWESIWFVPLALQLLPFLLIMNQVTTTAGLNTTTAPSSSLQSPHWSRESPRQPSHLALRTLVKGLECQDKGEWLCPAREHG